MSRIEEAGTARSNTPSFGVLLIVAPFVFAFSDDDTAATAYVLVVGVGYVLLAVLTRYRDPKPA